MITNNSYKNNLPNKKKQNKIQITKDIINAAQIYAAKLVGYSFLYIFENKSIEVMYRKKDFKHLTGVETDLSADEFFKQAVNKHLQYKQISFSQRHPYDLCVKKVKELQNIQLITNSEILLIEDLRTSTALYKFGLTELNFTLCLNQDVNDFGRVVSDKYTPRSLRVEDSFKRSSNIYGVRYIFSKRNDEKYYNILNYKSKQDSGLGLSDNILGKIDVDLLSILLTNEVKPQI